MSIETATKNLAAAFAELITAALSGDTPGLPPEPAKAPVIELETVRGRLAEISRAGHTAQVRQLLQDFGATKLSDVPEHRYAELLTAADGISA